MKKLFLSFISVVLGVTLMLCVFAAESVEIKMTIGSETAYVNGEAHTLDAAPVIRNNRTMLPIRFVAEKLGASVEWNEDSTVTIVTAENIEIKIAVGSAVATVNGIEKELDSPAFIESGRTFLPVRFVAQVLGADVEWDGETSTATITHSGFIPFPDDYQIKYPVSFDYSAVNIDEYVTLGQYKGLTLEGTLPAQITDDDVEKHIASLMTKNPEKKEITDRAAQNGDKIIVNFVGKIDGVAFDGGTAENYKITLGNGGFIEGFEEGMVGMKVGETKAVETVFPENYQASDLAGKTAIFDITLLSIYEEIAPALTDEYVKANFGANTVEEFKASVKEQLSIERIAEINEAKYSIAMASITEGSEVTKYPEGLVADYMYRQIYDAKLSAAQYGLTYEMLLLYSGYSIESFETAVRSSTERQLAMEMILFAIAKAENLTATEDECNALLNDVVSGNGLSSIDEFCMLAGFSKEELTALAKSTVIYDKVQQFLLANNTFKG